MKRGRKPKPTEFRLIEGNRGKRPLNHFEPKPVLLRDLRAPRWLDRFGKDFWNDHAPELVRLRLLSELDSALLATACERGRIYRRSSAALKRRLTQMTDANGRCALPEVAIAKSALDSVRAILAEFGIGPSSRTRALPIEGQDDDDPASEFFKPDPARKYFK